MFLIGYLKTTRSYMYEEENFPKILSQYGEKSPQKETMDCIH